MSYHVHFIHDNVHGSIGLSDFEFRIVNTLAFQRLRKIKHLGLANLVFPGADHTRFSHSLGVLNIMGRMVETLERKGLLVSADTKKLRMAALLHDIGHYPLSHVIESVYKRRKKEIVKPKVQLESSRLSDVMIKTSGNERYGHHEKLGEKVITEREEVRNILSDAGLVPEEIAKIINGEHEKNPIYGQLMHSGLDADRIDYLMRDSALTGVSYGKIDLDYLLNHLDYEKGIIGVNYKGQHAVEHYLIARYFMYSQVIYHKTIMGFEAVAKALFDILAEEGIVYENFDQIQRIVNTDDFLDFNDNYFYSMITEGLKRSGEFVKIKPEIYKRYYRIINERRPLKLVREEKTLIERVDPRDGAAYSGFVLGVKKCLDGHLRIIGKEPDDVLFFEVVIKIEGLDSYYPVGSKWTDKDVEAEKELIKIIKKDRTVGSLVTDYNSVVSHLNKLSLKIARLYLRLDNGEDALAGQLKKLCE